MLSSTFGKWNDAIGRAMCDHWVIGGAVWFALALVVSTLAGTEPLMLRVVLSSPWALYPFITSRHRRSQELKGTGPRPARWE